MPARLDTRSFAHEVTRWAQDTFVRAVDEIAADLDRAAPVDTGVLQRGQEVRVSGTDATITYPADYASYTDEGTDAHDIHGAPLLAFEWGGELVIVRSVHHPGTRGTGWWSGLMNDEQYEQALEAAARFVRL